MIDWVEVIKSISFVIVMAIASMFGFWSVVITAIVVYWIWRIFEL